MDALFDVGCCRGSFNVRANNARAPNTKIHNMKASRTLGPREHDGRKNKIAEAEERNGAQTRRNTYKQTHIYTNTHTHKDTDTETPRRRDATMYTDTNRYAHAHTDTET